MGKKIPIFYCVFSIAFLIALFMLFMLRVDEIKKTNTERVSAGFDQVRHIVETTYTREASFDSVYFRDMTAKIFSLDTDLDLLVVYSYDTGIEYLRARDSRYLPGTAAQEIASVRGVPRFSYNNFSRTKIASSIAIPRKSSFIIEGVYRVLHDREVFILVRDTVIILVVFAIITAALALLLRLLDDGRVPASPKKATLPPPAGASLAKQAAAPVLERSAEEPASRADGSASGGVPEQAAEPAGEETLLADVFADGGASTEIAEPIFAAGEDTPEDAAETEEAETESPDSEKLEWRIRLEKRLSLELERSAYNEQDLTLLLLKITGLPLGSGDYRHLEREIESKLSFEDMAFEYPPDGFAVILPNVNLDQAIGTLKNFLRTIESIISARYSAPRCGLSSRNGRLMDGARLLYESEEALRKAEEEETDTIIGFRPDPGKYRAYIAEHGHPEETPKTP